MTTETDLPPRKKPRRTDFLTPLRGGQYDFSNALARLLNEEGGVVTESGIRDSGLTHTGHIQDCAERHRKIKEIGKKLRQDLANEGRDMMDARIKELTEKNVSPLAIERTLEADFQLVQAHREIYAFNDPKFDPKKVGELIDEGIFIGSNGRFSTQSSLTPGQFEFFIALRRLVFAESDYTETTKSQKIALRRDIRRSGRGLTETDFDLVREGSLRWKQLVQFSFLSFRVENLVKEGLRLGAGKRVETHARRPTLGWTAIEAKKKSKKKYDLG